MAQWLLYEPNNDTPDTLQSTEHTLEALDSMVQAHLL